MCVYVYVCVGMRGYAWVCGVQGLPRRFKKYAIAHPHVCVCTHPHARMDGWVRVCAYVCVAAHRLKRPCAGEQKVCQRLCCRRLAVLCCVHVRVCELVWVGGCGCVELCVCARVWIRVD